jgi:Heterokaryon incompatibility protein (HET)
MELLWVDAICIKQSDPSELNVQLLIMNWIYMGSSIVHVDLGDIEPERYDALNLMHKLSKLSSIRVEQPPWITSLNVDDLPQYGLPPTNDFSWHLFSSIFGNPWFRRTSVV